MAKRLRSLDALRGLDMLLIVGLDRLIHSIAKVSEADWVASLSEQFYHVPWEGVRIYDMIFPLFMFIAGVAIPFSMQKKLAAIEAGEAGLAKLWLGIAKRVLLLVILGFFYNGVFAASETAPRFVSVLGQIGIAWGLAASVFVLARKVWVKYAILGGVLVAVAVAQLLVPVPGVGAGQLTADGSINAFLDQLLLPGSLHGGSFDPEGVLCIFSAFGVTLAGALMGERIRRVSERDSQWQEVLLWFAVALGLVLAGWLCWELGYPPIKKIWTSSFNLWVIGISVGLMGLFYWIIDVLGWWRWSFPLQVVGQNPLTIYLAFRMVSFYSISNLIFGRLASHFDEAAPVVLWTGVLLIELGFLYFLYRQKWFLRV